MRNPWIYRAPALAWGFLIIYLSLAPVQDLDPGWELNVSDKLVHGVLYFTWVVLLYFGTSRAYQKPVSRRKMAFYWAFAIASGVGLEFLQGVMNFGRSADALDALANTGGAVIAIVVSRILHKFLA
jgi:glycopeptide antibiotics resistance protein